MQKTAYEMRISDWSSDVCSADLQAKADLAKIRRLCAKACPEASPLTAAIAKGPPATALASKTENEAHAATSAEYSGRQRARAGDRRSGGEGKRVEGGVELEGRSVDVKQERIMRMRIHSKHKET